MEDVLNKLNDKLNDLENRLQALRAKRYQEGQKEYESLIQFIERIIDRLYPERQATELKKQLYIYWPSGSGNAQTDYVTHIDLATRVIDTIREEYELFGFDNFKPLKEKIETELQLGNEKIGVVYKKKKSN